MCDEISGNICVVLFLVYQKQYYTNIPRIFVNCKPLYASTFDESASIIVLSKKIMYNVSSLAGLSASALLQHQEHHGNDLRWEIDGAEYLTKENIVAHNLLK